jgi:transposase
VKQNYKQTDYTAYETGYQLKLPVETEIFISKDAPVRLLNAIVERMDMSSITRSYSRIGRIEYSPRILLKILLYAYVRRIYSSREIERACRENVHFMYLLEEHPAPDHNTICRFRSKYVKPTNHEQKKTRKYRTDISRRENMAYDAGTDSYTCASGKQLTFDYDKNSKSKNGFQTTTSVYSCKGCAGCPLKEKCIRSGGSKKSLEERSKVIYVSKRFAAQREAMEGRINTEQGKLLRVNRSIQAEGVFAMVKEDMNFRRFLLRGAVKVEVEWTLLSIAYNVLKLHHKLQKGRLGTGLVRPKGYPAGL